MGSSVFYNSASGFTVYYNSGSTGFTSPTWYGYPAVSVVTAPLVTTTVASGIAATSATLNGTVNPNGTTTTAKFEYGPTTGYGSMANVTLSPANGTTVQTVSASISSLQAGQTYHYRLTATNSVGTRSGADLTFTTAVAPLAPGELVAPGIALSGGSLNFTVKASVAGRKYQLQVSDTLAAGTWQDVGAQRIGDGANLVIAIPYVPAVRQRFYRLALVGVSIVPQVPAGFALIPAGPFQMGQDGISGPVHTLQVSAFYMGKYEVTKEEWDAVRTWGLANGYTDLSVGNAWNGTKGANHPVADISWYDVVKWCNARSQRDGLVPCYTISGATYKTGYGAAPLCNWSVNGYRLPTEAEWEKAARGGLSAQNFPWGNTITHSQANYYSDSSYASDVSPTRGDHPTYGTGAQPYTAPVGSFAPNGYGLYDMAGNVAEWCWDWPGDYAASSQTDPRGAATGNIRVLRGGGWIDYGVTSTRCADRTGTLPDRAISYAGFRVARGQP